MVDPSNDKKSIRVFDLMEIAASIRGLAKTCASMEDLAQETTQHLYNQLTVDPSGEPACALVRFFHTVEYAQLETRLQELARATTGNLRAEDKCLTLLGTSGSEERWNQRQTSLSHQVMPLLSPDMVAQSPMIARLLTQLGIEISSLFRAERRHPNFLAPAEQDYNIFYVPEAQDSPYIPAKEEFVLPYGIKSVIGYGSMLPSGELFAVVMFFRILIPEEVTQRFTALALSTMIACLQIAPKTIFHEFE